MEDGLDGILYEVEPDMSVINMILFGANVAFLLFGLAFLFKAMMFADESRKTLVQMQKTLKDIKK